MTRRLRVTVSCCGKFHAFALARQLERHGMLHRLLTTDPRAWLEPGLPRRKVWALPAPELLTRVPRRLGVADDRAWNHRKNRAYDALAERLVGDADLVTAWSGAGLRTLSRAKAAGKRVVVERGSTHIEHQNEVLLEEYGRFGVPIAPIWPATVRCELDEYALADRIVVPSTFTRRTFLARGVPADKVVQVPYGSDASLFRPADGPGDGVFRVVFVGGIGLRKGVWYLLEAMRRLKLPNAELVLVGPVLPEFAPHLAKFDGLFRHAGTMPRPQVAELLRACSVFVLPSLEEGLSLALREAQATGLPIVATPETGAEDVLQDGVDGFLVGPRDVDALCDRLARLHADAGLRAAMGKAALARARGWSWDDYGDAVARAYEGLAGSRPGPVR